MMLGLYKNYKPFGFFTFVSAILTLIAIAFAIPVFITFFETGMVPRIPTLVVCGFVELAAVQAFFAGVILSNLTNNSRREFEQIRISIHLNRENN